MPLCLSGGRSVGHLGRYCACFASLSSFGSSSLFSADNHQKGDRHYGVCPSDMSYFQSFSAENLSIQSWLVKLHGEKDSVLRGTYGKNDWHILGGTWWQAYARQKQTKSQGHFFFLQMGDFPEFNRVLEKGDSFHVCLCVGKLRLVDGEKRTPHSHTPSLREKPPTIPTQLKCPTWSTFWWNLRSEMCQLLPAVVSGAQGILGLVCSWGWMEGGLIHCKFRPDSEDLGPLCLAVIFLNYKENKSN